MPSQRIRGQEVSISMIQGGQTVRSFGAIRDVDFTPEFDLMEEGYLGEVASRFDDIFKGWTLKATIHTADAGVFDFLQAVIDRAQRRVVGVQFNMKATLAYPNGDRPRLIFKDLFFGGLPIGVPSRTAYVTQTLNAKCSTHARIG